jgi:sortase A
VTDPRARIPDQASSSRPGGLETLRPPSATAMGKHRAGAGAASIRFLAAVSVLTILAGGLLLGHIWLYSHQAKAAAARLDGVLRSAIGAADSRQSCQARHPSPNAGSGPRMLLSIPRIGLTAPVLGGTSEAALNVGVGHLRGSRWPGEGGTVVLEAHDVTFFTDLDKLHRGSTLHLIAPCRSWSYRVTGGRVVNQGTAIAASADPRLVLVTCWPTDALFYTSQRYVVTADLVSATTKVPEPAVPRVFSAPAVRLPRGLRKTNLSVDAVGVPLGQLDIAGEPSRAWRASAAPLQASNAGVRLFDAVLLSLRDDRPAWWSSLAPNVPAAAADPMWLAPEAGFAAPVEVTVLASGSRATAVSLATRVVIAGNLYTLQVAERVQKGRLVVTQWSVVGD